ncbi:hypothetical protein GYMLUDRAFT_42991 [Collybiopsis luxurians FD-317 M1]|uniref:Methyltransferase domain-containing protein n=1 Tax=Collybiopsis luxurians FD-317 M1 TaxID=944289 RepID=A0A0D0CQR4_9AGAR|nr:hypothetical protein GYMLUDRAFT_42991 [Collybiopsis luxurians FD-317 M1]
MDEHDQNARYYASEQYFLPADEAENKRLNLQHQVIVRAFDNKLSLAPLSLKSGDRVLESAAATGIWAFEFFEENERNGVILNMECIDISSRPFPKNQLSSNIHFSVHSAADLPGGWNSTFSFVHQRLLIAALDDPTSRSIISEFFRVLLPGGWVELVEIEGKDLHYAVGPSSTRLQSILVKMIKAKELVGNLNTYLPRSLAEAGFVDVQCDIRNIPIGIGEGEYSAEAWGKFWRGLKRDVMDGGGYGVVKAEDEYEELVDETVREWKTCSKQAYITYYTILARKP